MIHQKFCNFDVTSGHAYPKNMKEKKKNRKLYYFHIIFRGYWDSEKRVKFLQFPCYFSSCVQEKLKKITISVLRHGLKSQGHERTTTTKSHNFTILVLFRYHRLRRKKGKTFMISILLCRPKKYHGKKKQETLLFLNYF